MTDDKVQEILDAIKASTKEIEEKIKTLKDLITHTNSRIDMLILSLESKEKAD